MLKRFKKYGAIESTEMLASGKEGYVTFASDLNAGFAFVMEKENSVEIAYSWKQPSAMNTEQATVEAEEPMDLDEPATLKFLDLNDDCLLELFDRCNNEGLVNLSETCKRLAALLKNSYGFSEIDKQLSITLFESGKYSMTLANIRKMLRLMGTHFSALDFDFRKFTRGSHGAIIQRYLKQVAKYCKSGTVQKLYFEVGFCQSNFISLLAPLFENLRELTLHVEEYGDNFDVDFGELCPNLKKLAVYCGGGNNLRWDIFLKKPFPMLETFYFDPIDEMTNEFFTFFTLHPQIKYLKSCGNASIPDHRLPALVERLPALVELRLCHLHDNYDPMSHNLRALKNLQNLEKLQMAFQSFEDIQKTTDGAAEIITSISEFNNLRVLILDFYYEEGFALHLVNTCLQSVIGLAKSLRNLEQFKLCGLKLDEETVAEFVQHAKKLKELHLHHCEVFSTRTLIAKLVDVWKLKQQSQEKLKLVLDNNDRNLRETQVNGAEKYLTINYDSFYNDDVDFD